MSETNETGTDLQKITMTMHEVMNRKWGDLDEAEEAFRRSSAVQEYALLVESAAAWQIAERRLWQGNFSTLEQYLEGVRERLNCSRAYFFERVRIFEAFRLHGPALYAAGFQEDRDASKLRLLFKAQKAHDTERAIKYLPRMTYREYAKWTAGEAKLIEQEAARRQAGERTKVDGFGIRYEGEIVVSARVVEKICAEGKIPFVVGVLDEAEKQAIHKMLSKRREREAKKNAGQ